MTIHPQSHIDPKAQLDKDITVEAFSYISNNVQIGKGTWIGPHVTIMEGARIGANCKIYPGAVISAPPQDLKYKNEKSIVKIGANSTIRECATINRGTTYAMETTIGTNSLIMAYTHIAHDCIVGNQCIVANSVNLAGHIQIDDYVRIGGAVNIQQFVRIGQHAFVSGGTLVKKDIPPYTRVANNPLSYVGVNSVGLRRQQYSQKDIDHILDIYRVLFVQNQNISKGVMDIQSQIQPSVYKEEILQFIDQSKIGLIRGFRKRK